MARPGPKLTPPDPPEDPLADLRQESGPVLPPADDAAPAVQENNDAEPEVLDIRPMVSQDVQDAMLAEAVAALHADTTCQGFLHGGGHCGCRYIARVVLQTTVPVALEEALELARKGLEDPAVRRLLNQVEALLADQEVKEGRDQLPK